MTATAADELCLWLALHRDPAPARRTLRYQKGLDKPDLEVGDAGLDLTPPRAGNRARRAAFRATVSTLVFLPG